MAKDETTVYVELRFSPSWALISDVRRFVDVFFRRTLEDSDAASRVALAAHELLENATKYSVDGEARLRLEVEPAEPTPRLSIHVSNRTNPDEIERLEKRFAAMTEEPDAFRYYQQLLRSARGRRDRAGLGLARIQAEADVALSLEVEGDIVHIRGRTQLEEPS
jgi:hypothetical protein